MMKVFNKDGENGGGVIHNRVPIIGAVPRWKIIEDIMNVCPACGEGEPHGGKEAALKVDVNHPQFAHSENVLVNGHCSKCFCCFAVRVVKRERA